MQYLRTRKRGKGGNCITRFIQVRVPEDLREAYGGKPYVERYLKPSTLWKVDAKLAIAEIEAEFAAKRGNPLDHTATLERVRQMVTANTFEQLRRSPIEAPDNLSTMLEDQERWGEPDVDRAKQALAAVGEPMPPNGLEAVAATILAGGWDALELFRKGMQPTPPERPTKPLYEVAEAYFAYREHDANAAATAQTLSQYRTSVRLFQDHVGRDTPIGRITREHAVSFLDTVAMLHPDYGRHGKAAKMTLQQLLIAYPGRLKNTTLNRHKRALSGMFAWAIDRDWFQGASPFDMKPRPIADNPWLPFTIEQLNRLLERPQSNIATDWNSTRPWLSMIALFSGLRQGEIAELGTENIIEVEGVPMFDIVASKSEAGVRRVPIHSTLLRYGFLDYVDGVGQGYLWPALKPGGPDKKRAHYVAKWFPAWKRKRDADGHRCFHSFRKNVVSEFLRQRVQLSEYAGIIGHEKGFTVEVYAPLGLTPSHAQELVEKLEYPGLRLP